MFVFRNWLKKIDRRRRKWVIHGKWKLQSKLFASIYSSFGTSHGHNPLSNIMSNWQFHILNRIFQKVFQFLQCTAIYIMSQHNHQGPETLSKHICIQWNMFCLPFEFASRNPIHNWLTNVALLLSFDFLSYNTTCSYNAISSWVWTKVEINV